MRNENLREEKTNNSFNNGSLESEHRNLLCYLPIRSVDKAGNYSEVVYELPYTIKPIKN